jgi:hypothetical protein
MALSCLPRGVAAIVITAGLVGGTCLTTPLAAAETVSSRELHRLFPGRFHAIAHGFIKVRITALADGSLFAQQLGKSDSGLWTIRSGRLCIKFSKWLKARTRCSVVTKQDGWYRTSDVSFKRVGDDAVALR